MKRLLFVCAENAGRNQMAEAFANYYGKGKIIASSAGNKPSDKVNPTVVEALKEKGISISTNKPKLLIFQMAQDADLIVTMGCNDLGFLYFFTLQIFHRLFSTLFKKRRALCVRDYEEPKQGAVIDITSPTSTSEM